MNRGYDDDDDGGFPPAGAGGPGGLFAHLLGGFGGGRRPTPAHSYDDYFKAFSVATMPHGHDRPQLMYGGKIIMPPSALARLTSLDIDGPWTFCLRNPRNPHVNQTHAGVLEFIADDPGIVYLPAWMMQTLQLNEGDPIRLTGTELPKGKFVKIQAQSVDFLQVSDPKAVLESALRAYSALTKGDIIEITYNSLTFEFLVMETQPEGPGISIIDTDLEVDFAPPKGYVEPERKMPAPPPTMADKLKIDTASMETSRPQSSLSVHTQGSGDNVVESFTGVGHSLSGKRVRGKGLAKKIEEVDPTSKINRNIGPRIITPDNIEGDRKVPGPLILPKGKFFFGFKYIPFESSKVPKKPDENAVAPPSAFQGEGNSLRKGAANSAAGSISQAAPSNSVEEDKPDPWANLGSGNTLSGRKRAAEKELTREASPPQPSREEIIDATMMDEDDFMFGEDYDYDDGDDYIEVDSD
ncbi:hypothetical protein CspeluHIS016_0703770 [Cutaneotrichosporon spelunceum]|uniref:UFD1-domain-containing protein n=1 Tax=Cutaneotrichosporon spelunceum TaxID=1672016 RepID=A0AAD3YEW3_9TREE|nr:hypothetical protein CspeluHIS016_0703770 [Cutaneotrichosporon spelunceum]